MQCELEQDAPAIAAQCAARKEPRMIFRRIGRFVRRAVDFGKNAIKTVTNKVSDIIKKPMGLVTKVLNKIPLPKFLKGVVGKFLQSPLAALLPGPLGAIAATFMKAGSLGDLLGAVKGVAGSKAFSMGPPAARNNIFQLAASQQARLFFPNMFK